jgi:DNA-damage-inducible protein J
MASTSITMRIDTETKSQLQELLSKMGMDLTTFFTLAAKQAIIEQGMPFKPSLVKDVPKE